MRYLLLIEDELLLQRTLEKFLEVTGYYATASSSREEAMTWVSHWHFHAIVMDYVDSGCISPAAFVSKVHSCQFNSKTPIVVMTAFSYLPEDLDVQAVLHKPFDLNMLTQVLRRLIK